MPRDDALPFAGMRKLLLVATTGLALMGCTIAAPTQTRAVWVRGDGTTPTVEEFRAAERGCEKRVNAAIATNRDPDTKAAAWAVRMGACMEEHGLFLVEKAAP